MANANTFADVSKCTLLVPQGSCQECWLKDGWGDLSRISEFAPDDLVAGQVNVHVQTTGTRGGFSLAYGIVYQIVSTKTIERPLYDRKVDTSSL